MTSKPRKVPELELTTVQELANDHASRIARAIRRARELMLAAAPEIAATNDPAKCEAILRQAIDQALAEMDAPPVEPATTKVN